MVKGVSRQVIVVHAPEPKMFEQAIFILKESAVGQEGVTDEDLLQEARRILYTPSGNTARWRYNGPAWAAGGALVTGLVWLITGLL